MSVFGRIVLKMALFWLKLGLFWLCFYAGEKPSICHNLFISKNLRQFTHINIGFVLQKTP